MDLGGERLQRGARITKHKLHQWCVLIRTFNAEEKSLCLINFAISVIFFTQ